MMRRGILSGWILGVLVFVGCACARCAARETQEGGVKPPLQEAAEEGIVSASRATTTDVVSVAQAATEPKKVESKNAADWLEGVSPSRKPADAPAEMKELVGLYRNGERKLILEEWVGVLRLTDGFVPDGSDGPGVAGALEKQLDGKWKLKMDRSDFAFYFTVERAADGKVVALDVWPDKGRYVRADAGADPKSFYRVTPVKPLEELRAAAKAAKPPVEKGPFRKPELVELTKLDAEFHLDIRYANSNNFLSTPVYSEARAFMQKPAAEALERVSQKLKPMGYGLLIHDAYRPWYVTKIFWDATPVEGHIFVADPQKGSKHNRGCAVDLTMYDPASGAAVEMPGLYDEMSERSFPDFPGGTWRQRWQRDLLRKAMESEGFTVDPHEWWHFDFKDWRRYPILNVGFEEVR
jgi:zinc D-Ala-D-Ala dipeptidase